MKVIVGGISHETNTYATALWGTTELSAFTQSSGAGMLEKHRSARTCVGGMLSAAAALGIEIVPTGADNSRGSGLSGRGNVPPDPFAPRRRPVGSSADLGEVP
jgi:microcystin degradation protein MlrC